MIKLDASWWGIKKTTDDLSDEMMRIINEARSFILVCGYNFTFRTSATSRPFFDTLIAKKDAGVPVLMIFPPSLHAQYNPQPAIIEFCIVNGIPVILNKENHSKWMLTEQSIYYGSSNFTTASWTNRVEVISIHDHTEIKGSWARQTIADFRQFIDEEIVDLLRPSRSMMHYPDLVTLTRDAWDSIRPLVMKLNPSIEKVIATLENYESVLYKLNEVVIQWFDNYYPPSFKIVFDLSNEIMNAYDNLCSFAYGNIYNESISPENQLVTQDIVNRYNALHAEFITVVDRSEKELSRNTFQFTDEQHSARQKNFDLIYAFKQKFDRSFNLGQ